MRAFADALGRVRVIARDGSSDPFTTGTANVFVERDYYTISSVDDENDSRLIEGLYSEVEGRAAPVFEQLAAGDYPLDAADRAEFAAFMALQVTRGRHFRAFMCDVTDKMGRSMLRMAATAPAGYWAARRAEWEASREGPEPPAELTQREREMLIEGKGFDIVPSREHVVEMSFVAFEEMTFSFMAKAWRLVRFKEPCLFSSEHPITYWRRPSSIDRMGGIGPETADEVRLPLSPTRALVLTPKERHLKPFDPSEFETVYDLGPEAARRLNWGTLTFPPRTGSSCAPRPSTRCRRTGSTGRGPSHHGRSGGPRTRPPLLGRNAVVARAREAGR